MPDVDSTLQQVSQWKYIIVTDLSKALSDSSVKRLLSSTAELQPHLKASECMYLYQPWVCQEAKPLWRNFCAEFLVTYYMKGALQS